MAEPQPGQEIVIVCRPYDSHDAEMIEHSAKGACANCHEDILMARSSRDVLRAYPGSIAICYSCARIRLVREPYTFGGILPMQRDELKAHLQKEKRPDM